MWPAAPRFGVEFLALFGSAARVANSIPRPDFFYLSDSFLGSASNGRPHAEGLRSDRQSLRRDASALPRARDRHPFLREDCNPAAVAANGMTVTHNHYRRGGAGGSRWGGGSSPSHTTIVLNVVDTPSVTSSSSSDDDGGSSDSGGTSGGSFRGGGSSSGGARSTSGRVRTRSLHHAADHFENSSSHRLEPRTSPFHGDNTRSRSAR